MEKRRMVTYDRDGKEVGYSVEFEPVHRHPWGPFLLGAVLKAIVLLCVLCFGAGMFIMWLIEHHRI